MSENREIDGLIKVAMDASKAEKQSDALAKKLEDLKKRSDAATKGIEKDFSEMAVSLNKSIKSTFNPAAPLPEKINASVGRAKQGVPISKFPGSNLSRPKPDDRDIVGTPPSLAAQSSQNMQPVRTIEDIRAELAEERQKELAAKEARRAEREAKRQQKLLNEEDARAAAEQTRIDRARIKQQKEKYEAAERDEKAAAEAERKRILSLPVQGPREATPQERADQKKAVQETARIERMVLAEKLKVDKALADNVRIRAAEELKSTKTNARLEKESAEKISRDKIKDAKEVQKIMDRTVRASADVQKQVASILNAPGAALARQGMMGSGVSRQQASLNQLQAGGIAPNQAQFLAGFGGRRPPGLGPGGSGIGGFFRRNAGSIASSLATGLGLGAGAYGIGTAINAGKAVIESTQLATAYDRQEIASRNLAGSQEQLNKLMAAYEKSSGGAIDKSTELADVTRLLATGFANSVEDVERFVRSTRGASIALGKPQDYIIQETQLAISNTSVKRLDQIGLGISEVTDRIEVLQQANKDLSREEAFRESVIGLLDAKYGVLTNTLEGQATGLERLTKAWKDLRLAMGQGSQGPINAITGALATGIAGTVDYSSMRTQTRENLRNNPAWKPEFGASAEEREAYRTEKQMQEADKWWAHWWVQSQNYFRQLEGLAPLSAQRNFTLRNPEDFGASAPGGIPAAPLTGFAALGEEGQKAVIAAYDAELQVSKNANKARLQEIENFEMQRESIIISYGKSLVREEEDFARQRARGLRDYERSILEVAENAHEREKDALEDYGERVAESKEDSEKRISEMQEEYNENREKAEKKHKDAMLKAAGQLDAIAVLEERKRWKEQNEEAEKGHKKSIEKERDNLQERLDDAKKAYDKQIEEGREADQRRLEDMRVSRAQQLADEDEDRALRLARAAEDHDDQLKELDRQHTLRLEKIVEQAEEETQAIQDALEKDLTALEEFIDGAAAKTKKREIAISDWFDDIINKIERSLLSGTSTENEFGAIDIPVVYGGRSDTAAGGGNKTVIFERESITINALPGMNIYDFNELVEDTMIKLLENN
jgi:hypothetical protein